MKKKIAILDDEPSISMIIELNLGDEYHIKSFFEKSAFISSLSQNRIDALVLDLNLSGESGKSILSEIRAGKFDNAAASIPVIILSGEDSTQEKISCLELGADDYLVKPFNPMELRARMNRVFARINGK